MFRAMDEWDAVFGGLGFFILYLIAFCWTEYRWHHRKGSK